MKDLHLNRDLRVNSRRCLIDRAPRLEPGTSRNPPAESKNEATAMKKHS